MANNDADRHHTIDYVEFQAQNLEATKAFYASAFGWRFNDYGPDYSGIGGATREMGGFSRGDASSGTTLAVIYSDDLEATLTAVVAAGGSITKETFSFPGGRRFHFADPAGNGLAVWTQA